MSAALIDDPGFRELRRFYRELTAAVQARAESEVDPALVAKRVRVRLQRVLLDEGMVHVGPDRAQSIDGYLLAGIADELLLYEIAWEGRSHWGDLLLEEALFDSRVAGERFLQIADQLLAAPAGTMPATARILLGGLLLGFRGRCRDGDGDELRRYRERLYERVTDRPFDPGTDAARTLRGPQVQVRAAEGLRSLPRLAPWIAACGLLVGAYLGAAHLVWRAGVDDILDGSAEVLRIRETIDVVPRGRP